MKTTLSSLILFALLSLTTFAQDYTQWGLPEGAERASEKEISVSYSIRQMGRGLLLQLPAVFGFMTRRPIKKSPAHRAYGWSL